MTNSALDYKRRFLRGRILRAVSSKNISTTILGQKSSLPIYIFPVCLGKLVHPEGECAIAAADGKEGIIQVVNTVSSNFGEIIDGELRKINLFSGNRTRIPIWRSPRLL